MRYRREECLTTGDGNVTRDSLVALPKTWESSSNRFVSLEGWALIATTFRRWLGRARADWLKSYLGEILYLVSEGIDSCIYPLQ